MNVIALSQYNTEVNGVNKGEKCKFVACFTSPKKGVFYKIRKTNGTSIDIPAKDGKIE